MKVSFIMIPSRIQTGMLRDICDTCPTLVPTSYKLAVVGLNPRSSL